MPDNAAFLSTKPKAVLFDWDNTLVDSWLPIHKALEETFLVMGRTPWTLEETKERVRTSAREAFPVLFPGRSDEAMSAFYDAYERSHIEVVTPLYGARELLDVLHQAGCLLGLVSNKKGDLLRKEVEALGWEGFFHSVVGANDAAKDKPARDVLELALQGTALEPGQDVWFVGDTDIDMLCASLHGCPSVLIRENEPREGEFANCWPDQWFSDCLSFSKGLKF
ncbi:HAD family hydrolase [Kiloniella sp. b19]|uniref:HAD family hydrolase n=1 Tax=Kiloniella sp. GXU_MW_B19 TaxID=3141326 RepID=UPI0031E3F71F